MKDLTHLVIGTVALFMTFSPFPSFAQVIQPIDRLAVFDANGTKVGPVVGLHFDLTEPIQWVLVPLVIDDFLGSVKIRNQQFYGIANVFFSSTDCTGQPLMLTQQEAGGEPFEETFAVIGGGDGTGNTVWRPDPSGVPSIWEIDGSARRWQRFSRVSTN